MGSRVGNTGSESPGWKHRVIGSPGWNHRVGNPGYNDTKSAFADCSMAYTRDAARGASVGTFTTSPLHQAEVKGALALSAAAKAPALRGDAPRAVREGGLRVPVARVSNPVNQPGEPRPANHSGDDRPSGVEHVALGAAVGAAAQVRGADLHEVVHDHAVVGDVAHHPQAVVQ